MALIHDNCNYFYNVVPYMVHPCDLIWHVGLKVIKA